MKTGILLICAVCAALLLRGKAQSLLLKQLHSLIPLLGARRICTGPAASATAVIASTASACCTGLAAMAAIADTATASSAPDTHSVHFFCGARCGPKIV